MSLGISTQDFDRTFHRLIEALTHQDREEARAAYRAWQMARAQMADHQAKATESAATRTGRAIAACLQATQEALSGDLATLAAGYSQYLAARDELFKLAGGDGLFYLIAESSAPTLDASFFTSRKDCDIKGFLDGIQRLGESPLNRRRGANL